MAKRKKTFPCGHIGYGQSCHRCDQAAQQRAQQQAVKRAWQDTFQDDPIDLREFPQRIVVKTREILSALADNQDYRLFRGKRLRHDREVISIPVTSHYRLLCRDRPEGIVPEALVSHEDYNVVKPGS